MTALQFKKAREKLFPTQVAAAEAMGVSRVTISEWERNVRPVPKYAEKLLAALKEVHDAHHLP